MFLSIKVILLYSRKEKKAETIIKEWQNEMIY